MKTFLVILSLLMSTISFASEGLTIHALEIGVGKFHRKDNKVHPYAANNAWTPYILPDNAATDVNTVVKNADGSYSIFYVTLQDMMNSAVKISKEQKASISVLNVHGHGLPGGMWFPKNQAELQSSACEDWVQAASGSDDANYDQYYSAISKEEIDQIKMISNVTSFHMGCTTGVNEWKEILAAVPEFKTTLASDAQVHFLSCVVGMGKMGDNFTKGVAELLLTNAGKGRVVTSMEYGLGDWSMPEGMGFWNYQNDEQLDRDNANYVVHRKDRKQAQKGTMRIATVGADKTWGTQLLANQDFMTLGFDKSAPQGVAVEASDENSMMSVEEENFFMPDQIRIPGTGYHTSVNRK